MLARSKAEVGAELPPRVRQVIEVPLPTKARSGMRKAMAAIDWRGNARQGVGDLLSGVESYKLDAAVEIAQKTRSRTAPGRCS